MQQHAQDIRPLPGRREKRKIAIRNRILDAAYALFRDQGIKDSSIEQICAAADVARRTFYSYYPDKQALLSDLSRTRVFNTAEGMFEAVMGNHRHTRERVAAMIDYIEKNLAGYSDIDRTLLLITPSSFNEENHLRDASASVQDQFREIFLAGQEANDFSAPFSAEILSEMMVGTLNTLMVSWALDGSFPILKKLDEARALFDHILATS